MASSVGDRLIVPAVATELDYAEDCKCEGHLFVSDIILRVSELSRCQKVQEMVSKFFGNTKGNCKIINIGCGIFPQ
jgi:hypothetical protein